MANREFAVATAHSYDHRSPVRWLWSHLRRYPVLPVVAILGTTVNSALMVVPHLLVGQAFDVILSPAPDTGHLLTLALMIFGVGLLRSLIQISASWTLEIVSQRLERDAREELVISLLGKSQTFHSRQQVGDVMARATNDVREINFMFTPGLWLIAGSILNLIIPPLTIALRWPALLPIPLLFVIGFGFALRLYMRELAPVSTGLRASFGRMNAGLAEAIGGIEVVKAYAQEGAEAERFNANARAFRDLSVRQGIVQGRYLPMLMLAVTSALSLGHALLLFQAGALSVGDVVAFMGLVAVLRFPTFISVFTFSLVQLGLASAERILALITAETELDQNSGGVSQPIAGDIIFDNVTFGYGAEPLLRDVSFRAAPGETIAIVGQTGSGKTTLTRLVNRTYDVTAGRVLIDGVDVREWSLDALRSQISTIEQDVFLFSRSAADNVGFGAAGLATREQIQQAAREAQAHEFVSELPQGYDTVIGERGVTLSGGQRQRLAIARAFLTDPRILILDDSTSAIDSATKDQIQRAMRRIMRGRTTLLITHRLSQIRWADRILVLRQGQIVDSGSHDELLERCVLYRRIFSRYERESVQPSVVGVATGGHPGLDNHADS